MDAQITLANRPVEAKTSAEICRAVNADFKLQGITHAKAAALLGVDRRCVSNQLSGKRPFAKKGAILYAKVFGYNESFLLFGTGSLRNEPAPKTGNPDALFSRFLGKADTGLLEEIRSMFLTMDDLRTRLLEAEEAYRQMEKQLLIKEDEIARLTSIKKSSALIRARYRKGRSLPIPLSRRAPKT